MPQPKKLNKHPKELNLCLNTFFLRMREQEVEKVYKMLSPNLRLITLEKKHSEKYQQAFLFHRHIEGFFIHELFEINPILLEAVVIVGMQPLEIDNNGEKLNNEKADKHPTSTDDLRYKILRIRFININDHYYIDEIYLNNDYIKDAA